MRLIVLPDDQAVLKIACKLSGTVVSHPSGRPWIVGDWESREVVSAQAGASRIVLLGTADVTPARLREILVSSPDYSALDSAVARIAGNFFVLVAFGDRMVARGTANGVRRLFHTTTDGVIVAGDRPDRLAALADAGVDSAHVVRHLLLPGAPWPVDELTSWTGVHALEPGDRLRWMPDGQARTERWWTVPAAEDAPPVAARRVHDALAAAVAARGREGVSTDLSGGMDSTSITFLAHPACSGLTTFRFEAVDPTHDDARWADGAARSLQGAEHLVLARSQIPSNFEGALDPIDPEEPFGWLRVRAQLDHQAKRIAAAGSRSHMTGHGGDELFMSMPAHEYDAVRRRPWSAVRRSGPNRHLRRWDAVRSARYLLDGRSYSVWLRDMADCLGTGLARQSVSAWGDAVIVPPWTSAEAVEGARRLLRDAARVAEPHSTRRAAHTTVDAARRCGDTIRRADRLTRRHGVSWHAPMLDDHVLEAVLAARPDSHGDATAYKPLLAEAMRGVVPAEILGRPTKAEFSADVYEGLRRHRAALVEQCADLRLARLGLIDGDVLRRALQTPQPAARGLIQIAQTLAVESWLRSVEKAGTSAPLPGGTR